MKNQSETLERLKDVAKQTIITMKSNIAETSDPAKVERFESTKKAFRYAAWFACEYEEFLVPLDKYCIYSRCKPPKGATTQSLLEISHELMSEYYDVIGCMVLMDAEDPVSFIQFIDFLALQAGPDIIAMMDNNTYDICIICDEFAVNERKYYYDLWATKQQLRNRKVIPWNAICLYETLMLGRFRMAQQRLEDESL